MNLLSKMLEIDSCKRIPVNEALMKEFLASGFKHLSPVLTIACEEDR